MIALLKVEYAHGAPETYVIPLAFAEDVEPSESARAPSQAIAHVTIDNVPERGTVTGVLYDALGSELFATTLLRTMMQGAGGSGERGSLAGMALAALRELPPDVPLAPRLSSAEQSNTSIMFGDKVMLKIFRAIEEGPSLEYEIGHFLSTREPPYRGVPRLGGVLEYKVKGSESTTIGTLFEFVPNQGDAWKLTLDSLDRYFDGVLSMSDRPAHPPVPHGNLVQRARTAPLDQVIDYVGAYLDRCRLLGLRTAELHVVIASDHSDPLFMPEPYDIMHQQSMYGSVSAHMARTFDLLRSRMKMLSLETRGLAEQAIAREGEIDRWIERITRRRIDVMRVRTHGDYHLGQVLWTGDDFLIIDFEGEPSRPISQRRFKRSALRDVAGMLRSLDYASAAALRDGRHRPEDVSTLQQWARAWTHWVSASFLGGYLDRVSGTRLVPPNDEDFELLLKVFLVEKVIYEIGYELNNRPDWVEIPIRGLLDLLQTP